MSLHRRFANVYIGWGHKYITYNYSPPSMPPVQDQYIIGPEIMEIQDPTFEQEEAYRISQIPPPPVIPMGKINKINSIIGIEKILLFSRYAKKELFFQERKRKKELKKKRKKKKRKIKKMSNLDNYVTSKVWI